MCGATVKARTLREYAIYLLCFSVSGWGGALNVSQSRVRKRDDVCDNDGPDAVGSY